MKRYKAALIIKALQIRLVNELTKVAVVKAIQKGASPPAAPAPRKANANPG